MGGVSRKGPRPENLKESAGKSQTRIVRAGKSKADRGPARIAPRLSAASIAIATGIPVSEFGRAESYAGGVLSGSPTAQTTPAGHGNSQVVQLH